MKSPFFMFYEKIYSQFSNSKNIRITFPEDWEWKLGKLDRDQSWMWKCVNADGWYTYSDFLSHTKKRERQFSVVIVNVHNTENRCLSHSQSSLSSEHRHRTCKYDGSPRSQPADDEQNACVRNKNNYCYLSQNKRHQNQVEKHFSCPRDTHFTHEPGPRTTMKLLIMDFPWAAERVLCVVHHRITYIDDIAEYVRRRGRNADKFT